VGSTQQQLSGERPGGEQQATVRDGDGARKV
jgi:hypothetical protein